MRPTLRPLLLPLGLLVTPAAALAQDAPDVEALHRRGLALREQGRAADALDLFRQAQALRPEPRTLARMGLAEAELSRWPDAEAHLMAGLAASRDRWVRHHRDDLEAELDAVRAHLGSLEVLSRTPGASLSVNGGESRPLPLTAPLRVPEGPINLEVRADGCESARRTLAVSARGVASVDIQLSCRPAIVAASEAPVVVPPVVVPPVVVPPVARPAVVPPPAVAPPTSPPARTPRVLAWAAWGGAALFAGVGVFGVVSGSAAAARWNDDARCLAPGRSRESLCADERDAAETMGTVATVGFVGAGALVAAGAVLWALSGRAPERPAAPLALRCAPGLGAPSLHCALAF